MKGAFSRRLMVCLGMLALASCAAQTKTVRPDWQNPGHKLVGQQLVSLLRAVGRDPNTCKIAFFETEVLNAVSLGDCRFGFSTGVANTGDATLIAGVAAHEVAHDVLGHANKRQAAAATEQLIRTGVSIIPGIGGLIATSAVLVAGMVALPAYSRSQEAEADEKAVEILKARGDPNPAETMVHSFRVLLARHGAKGGGLLDTHPGTEDRLEAMLKLQRQQPPIETPLRTELAEAPAPLVQEPSTQSSPASPIPSQQTSPDQPSHDDTKPEVTAKTEPSPNEGGAIVDAFASRESSGIEQLGRGVSARELSQKAQTVVLLIYREGSPYSERVEESLRQVAGHFADRVSFFRSEVSATDAALVGPDARTMPILIVFRNGKERTRTTGLPGNRQPGGTPEGAIAEWLAGCLDD